MYLCAQREKRVCLIDAVSMIG